MQPARIFAQLWLLTVCALGVATGRVSAEPSAPSTGGGSAELVWNEMNSEKQAALNTRGNALLGSIAYEICQDCHRPDASGRVNGAYPRLAGQYATVLIKQMTDIRTGKRDNPKMEPYIGEHVLLPRDIADIAAFLQSLPIPARIGKGPGIDLARGKEIYDKDCANCHGDTGEGKGDKFYPMVASQHYRYLLREMIYIRNETRRNANPKMVKAVQAYDDDDLEAVADYMSQLPAPPATSDVKRADSR